MSGKLVSWIRGLNPVKLGLLFAGVALVGIVLTMGVMTRSFKGAFVSGGAFVLPLGLAVVIAQRFFLEPAKRKLIQKKDWEHPRTAAITAGLVISFATVLIMMLAVTVGFGVVTAARSPEGISSLFDSAKLPVNMLSLIYVTGVGLVVGSWVWIPVGIGLGLWMRPQRPESPSS